MDSGQLRSCCSLIGRRLSLSGGMTLPQAIEGVGYCSVVWRVEEGAGL